jgi:hypothetical protein
MPTIRLLLLTLISRRTAGSLARHLTNGTVRTNLRATYNRDFPGSAARVPLPKTSEERVDRFGIRTALLVLVIALFGVAMWLVDRPSFEKCSTLENVTERNACYEKLRADLSKPPAKGADIPKS